MATFLIQLIATGITIGGIYALIALGLHIIYNATGIFNMAQGGIVAWGGILLYLTAVYCGMPLLIAIIVTLVMVIFIAIIIQGIAVESVRELPLLVPILNCLFFGMILDSTSGIVLQGQVKSVPSFSKTVSINVFGAGIAPQSLWILGSITVILILLFLFFKKSNWGRIMVANADNPNGTKFIGVNPSYVCILAFCLSGVMAAIAGILISPITGIKGEVGLVFTLKGLSAAMLGGISSTPGVVVGGFLIGIFESLVGGFISSGLRDAFVYSLIIFVLVVKPTGIMGRKDIEKV